MEFDGLGEEVGKWGRRGGRRGGIFLIHRPLCEGHQGFLQGLALREGSPAY